MLEDRETPEDWEWPTWREAAINLKSIADNLGAELTAIQAAVPIMWVNLASGAIAASPDKPGGPWRQVTDWVVAYALSKRAPDQ